MFLNDFIRRRLASLLRPWLRAEPELEFKLGFLRGGGKLENISFNTSALNQLLGDSSGYRFKEVGVGELSVRFSCWSFPAISLHVRGLRIIISLGEEKKAGNVRPRKVRDTYLEDKKKDIADIDPEGSALHDAIEKISKVVMGSWSDCLTSTFLRYSQLQMDEVYILLLPPSSNDSVSCVMKIKEVGVESECSQHMGFLGGLISSSLATSHVCCLDLEIRNFEIGFQRESSIKYVVSPINLFVSIKLENLQLSDTVFYLPALCFSFSPADLSFMLIFSSFVVKESICARSGRHLWRIASSRISFLIHTPKLSWYGVASSVKLWLCYLRTYENMLLIVGYPDRDMIRGSFTKMLSDKKYSRSFKHHWDVISKCEENLPSEAIALARRTVRFRVSSAQFGKQVGPEFKGILWRVFHLFPLIWAMICHVLQQLLLGMLYFFRVVGHSRNQLKVGPDVQGICDYSYLESCIYLSVGILSVSLSPEKDESNMHGPSSFRFSSDDLISMNISTEAILVEYIRNFPDQHVKLSFGSIKVSSSDVEADNEHANQRLREQVFRKKKVLKPQYILWFEPAQRVRKVNSHGCGGGMASIPLLESLAGQIWLDWEKVHTKLVGNDFEISRTPCILIESKCYLIDPTAKSPTSGFHQVVMLIGRMNFVLENSAILAIALLFGQIQAVLRSGYGGGTNEVPDSSAWEQNLSVVDSNIERKPIFTVIETTLSRIIPEKAIQVGGLIAGPKFRLSLGKENSVGRDDGKLDLSFDVEDIEFVMAPNSESKFTETSEHNFQDEQLNGLRAEKPENVYMPIPTNEVYICQAGVFLNAQLKFNGLKAYLGGLYGKPGDEVIMLSAITLQSSLLRKQCHSFGLTIVATSVAMKWIATGFTAVVFLDELSSLIEVISSLYYVTSDIHTFGSSGDGGFQNLMRQHSAIASSESGSMLANSHKQIPASIQSIVDFKIIYELHSIDLALYHSRKSHNRDDNVIQANNFTSQKLAACTELDCGIYVSVQRICGRSSFKDGIVELLIDLSVIRYVLIRYSNPIEIAGRSEQISLKSLLLSMKCLLEASLSQFKFSLNMRTPEKSLTQEQQVSGADASTSYMHENVEVMETERQRDNSFYWLETNIYLGEFYLAEATVKDMLVKKNKTNNLNASFCAGEEFQTICCKSQGGSISLEIEAVLMLVKCLNLYSRLIEDLLQFMQPSDKSAVSQYALTVEAPGGKPAQDSQEVIKNKLGHLESVRISLSEFCCAAVCRDEFGRLQELLFEANAQLHVEAAQLRKVSFEISKFSISSQILHETAKQKYRNIQISHIPSTTSNDLSPSDVVGDPLLQTSQFKGKSVLQDEPFVEDSRGSTVLHSSPQNILKELSIVVVADWPTEEDGRHPQYWNQLWVGDGSITGCDISVSLTQLQMILSVVDSLSRIFSDEKINVLVQRQPSVNQESERSLLDQIPDGVIVAIEDVFQHTYIAVEDEGSGYKLVGTLHYSLVGEKSLFRVKHHSVGRWNQTQYFSLISLYAKDVSGEPLRLNSLSRSDYVSISASSDTAWALWSVIPYEPEAFNGYSDYGSDSFPIKNTFYLMNKKNDQSIAFIDGLLEFVSNPGNPFKLKIFHDPLPAGNDYSPTSCLVGNPGTITEDDSEVNDSGELEKNSINYRGITILVQKATLKIVHELLDTKETFPLLQGSVSSTEVIVQMLKGKARLMTCLEIMLHHFDSQRNMWRELINPLEICLFFRYRYLSEGSENVNSGVPGNFFARIKELNISLSELSLDMLLFVIGKLNLAGPFAVRSAVIMANSCKVENKSGLSLQCEFFDGQRVKVAGGQTHTFSLRHLALASHPPEASFFSIQLADKGSSTSVIRLSLLEAATITWRTRIVSSEESKTFPGPFVVVEVSQKNEDGLLIIVSPILRIHNETEFPMELRFQRPQVQEAKNEFASLTLGAGDSIDDSMATFGGVGLSGGIKKAFTSLSIGNFLFSFRPTITDHLLNANVSSIEWSDELRGEKPVPLAGIFEKLSYQVRSAVAGKSSKFSFGSACCAAKLEDGQIGNIHFLIQTIGKEVPVIQPNDSGYVSANHNLPIALQEQKEIFLLPTVHISNLLEMDIHVNLTDADPQKKVNYNLYSQARVPTGSDVNLYANPSNIFFTVSLTAFDSISTPVSSSQWTKKLRKVKNNTKHLDIELEFEGGKYFAFLRLSRGHRGVLEVTIYTSYTLRNDTENALYFTEGNHKPLSRDDIAKLGSRFPPELGAYLPPNSRGSWLIKNSKVWVKMVEELEFEALLSMDALSSLAEINLEAEEKGIKKVMKLGISLKPPSNETVPSLVVSLNPRHVVVNESDELILVRQCHLEDDMQGLITINSKQRTALKLQNGLRRKGEATVLENILRRHSKSLDDDISYIQFRLNDPSSCWSGPVCVASLGHFFLKFRSSLLDTVSQSNCSMSDDPNFCKFAEVHVVEEDSTLVLHFHRPPNADLPYRIENCLQNTSVTYYQKDSLQPEILGSGCSVDYVWDNLSLPHKLTVQLAGMHLLREINLDKVCAWKPIYRANKQRGMGLQFPVEMKSKEKSRNGLGELISTEIVKLGYEVYADGLTRVLRICEYPDRHKDTMFHSSTKLRFGISHFALQLLESTKKGEDFGEASIYKPIIIIRLEKIDMYSLITDHHKVNHITLKSLTVDEKREGAPFAAMLRKHQSNFNDDNKNVLQLVLVLLSSSSSVKHIKYLSIILQPLDLNLDEETLMRIVPFWRASLSDSTAPSQRYYFDHFEIHPVKIVANFLPMDIYSSYTSTQEMMRSLLHSVIQVPTIKNKTVELNGVLVTHALITFRELSVKCAQHYSWYALRAIYLAKGSPLLPPAFASMFDDFSSSSLDVFFDPSSGTVNLPGLTMGTFKFISKCIHGKGFSGTKRYFGDLGKTLKSAGSNILFAAVTELSDSVLRGAETNGFNGMVRGFHRGILNLAMEPSLLGSAVMGGGPDRKITLDRSPGVDELYIEGYLQALLDALYKQEYLRVRVIDNQVMLKNLPPNSTLINEIIDRVKGFLVSKGLLKGDGTTSGHSFRHIREENGWRFGPTVLTLLEHLFVSFAIRMLRKQVGKVVGRVRLKGNPEEKQDVVALKSSDVKQNVKFAWRSGIAKFILSGIVAYIDGRLCRSIPNPIARRVVSGFLLSFLDKDETE